MSFEIKKKQTNQKKNKQQQQQQGNVAATETVFQLQVFSPNIPADKN